MTKIEIICSEVRRNDKTLIDEFDKIEIYAIDEDTLGVRIYYDKDEYFEEEVDKVIIYDPYFHCSDKYEEESDIDESTN